MSIKSLLQKLYKVMYLLGFGRVMLWLNRDAITIVSMHGVMSTATPSPWVPMRPQLDPQVLDHCLIQLSRCYTFISLNEAVAILKKEKPPVKNGLVFTLDDGYSNNLTHALPVFKKFGVEAMLYIATKNIDQQIPFWFDRLDYALMMLPDNEFKAQIGNEEFIFDNSSSSALASSFKTFRHQCKVVFDNDLEMRDTITGLCELLEARSSKSLMEIIERDDWTRLANWPELLSAISSGNLNVGSHTVDHVRLALVSELLSEQELSESKNQISDKLTACDHFCYPDGNFNSRVAKQVKKSGYLSAVTVEMGLNRVGDDLMTLKRFGLPHSAKKMHSLLFSLSPLRQ